MRASQALKDLYIGGGSYRKELQPGLSHALGSLPEHMGSYGFRVERVPKCYGNGEVDGKEDGQLNRNWDHERLLEIVRQRGLGSL